MSQILRIFLGILAHITILLLPSCFPYSQLLEHQTAASKSFSPVVHVTTTAPRQVSKVRARARDSIHPWDHGFMDHGIQRASSLAACMKKSFIAAEMRHLSVTAPAAAAAAAPETATAAAATSAEAAPAAAALHATAAHSKAAATAAATSASPACAYKTSASVDTPLHESHTVLRGQTPTTIEHCF